MKLCLPSFFLVGLWSLSVPHAAAAHGSTIRGAMETTLVVNSTAAPLFYNHSTEPPFYNRTMEPSFYNSTISPTFDNSTIAPTTTTTPDGTNSSIPLWPAPPEATLPMVDPLLEPPPVEPMVDPVDVEPIVDPLLQPMAIADFVPLSCNARLSSTMSCSSWTRTFGVSTTHTRRIVVPCGQCVRMDHAGPVLTLDGGLDVQGKLVFADNYKLELRSPLVVVQGELELQAFKPVDGTPNIKFVMTGETDQTYTAIGENAKACGGAGTCVAGKKAIVVAGGRVNSK
jgi:G8 domain